jgi:hypothetical protein
MRRYSASQIYTSGRIRTEVKLRGKEFAIGMVKINGLRVWFKVRSSNDSKDYVRYFAVPKGASVAVGERKGSIKSVRFIPGGSGSAVPLSVVKTYSEEVIPIRLRFRIYDTSTVKHDGWAEAVVKLRGMGSSGGLGGVVNVNGKWLVKTAARVIINNTVAKHPLAKYLVKPIDYEGFLESAVKLDGLPATGAIKVNGKIVWKHFPINEKTHTYTRRVYLPAKGALHVGEYGGSVVAVRGAYSNPYRLRHTKTGQYLQRLSHSVGLRPRSGSPSQRIEVWRLCDGTKKIRLYKTSLCLTEVGGAVGLRPCGLDGCRTTYYMGDYHNPPKTVYTPTTSKNQRWSWYYGRLRSVSRHDRYLAAGSSYGGLHLTTYAPGTSTKKCVYNYQHQPINCYTVKTKGKNEAITAWTLPGF